MFLLNVIMDVVSRFKEVHGDKYDYRNVVYTKMINKVEIICPEHGSFFQSPHGHLKGQGCPKCGKASRVRKRTSTCDKFIERSKDIHGDRYDYSKVEYVNSRTKVLIVCPVHGEFYQTPNGHLNGYGCIECARDGFREKFAMSKDEFIKRSQEIHDNKYDYSNVEYVNNSTKVCIICPEHGKFYQTPMSHLAGSRCYECGIVSRAKTRTSTTDEFIKKSKDVHSDKYDYSNVEYVDSFTAVKIQCPIHGEFNQLPTYHLSGNGCSECGLDRVKDRLKFSDDDFIGKSKEVHGDKYDYSKVEYVNNRTDVLIICPKHGEFW